MSHQQSKRSFEFYLLEDRILLSGEGVASGEPTADAAEDVAASLLAELADGQATEANPQVAEQAEAMETSAATEPPVADPARPLEVVIVDAGVDDSRTLVEGLRDGGGQETQWYVLELSADEDGIDQITRALQQLSGVDAIHLISHGDGQGITLGNTRLDVESAPNYAGDIASWGHALDSDADLLIYGCDLASTVEGQDLIEMLAIVCDCDVAASDDATGHADLGGDWMLEYAVGDILTEVAFGFAVQTSWYSTLDITTGLVGHWELDDGSGTTADDATANNNDGTVNGTAVWTSGEIGGAFEFNYSDGEDYIEIPNSGTLENVQENDYSLAAWFRPDSTPPGSGSDNDANYGVLIKAGWHTGIYYGGDNRFHFDHLLTGDTSIGVSSTNTFTPGQFYHVVGVVDRSAGTVSLYVNGQHEGTSNFTPGTAAREYGTETWKLGVANPGGGSWAWPADGAVDDARIYSRALSSSDVSELADLAAPTETSLWFNTENDVTGSGVAGLDSWTGGTVLELGDPNLGFNPSTSGTVTSVFNIDDLVDDGDGRLSGLHYVSQDITVGTNSIQLQAGDVLFSTVNDEWINGGSQQVFAHDILLFEPDVVGDYSSGTLSLLLDGSDVYGNLDVNAFSLVEQATTVGTTTPTNLSAGDLLISHSGAADAIYRYQPGTLGGTSSGTMTVLLDGSDFGIDPGIRGLDLVESAVTLGDTTLTSGQLLITLHSDDNAIGGIATTRDDIFILDVTETGTSSAATAASLFQGDDIGVSTATWQENPWGLSLASSATVAAPPADPGLAIWAESGSSTPESSSFDGSAFGAEVNTANVGQWRIIQGAEAPTRDEAIIIGVDTGGTIDGQMWDGSSWNTLSLNPLGSVSQTYWWGMDVQYESQSGDALMVWTDGSNVEYATWNGSAWSSVSTLGLYSGATPRQLQLASSPNADEMVLVVSDSNDRDTAYVWDGDGWTNAVTLATNSADDKTDINVAYEQQSGHAMVVYGAGSVNARYQIWDGSSWSGESTLTSPGGLSGDVRWTTIASDPTSDRIAVGVVTSSNEAWFAVWDGSAWGDQLLAEPTTNGSTFPNAAVAFESNSGDLLATYAEGTKDDLRYRTWSDVSGWSGELVTSKFGTAYNSMTLSSDPFSDQIMLAVQDSGSDLYYVLWNGSAFESATEQETNTGETKNQPFLYLWNQQDADKAVLTAVQDTYIKLGETGNNFGSSTQMIVDRESGDLQRALVQFDLSSIPVGATIHSATLNLEATTIGGLLNIDVYQVLESWAEGTVDGTADDANWNNRDTSTTWTTAGGHFDAGAIDSLSTDATGQHSWNITTLVQGWVDGTDSNFGVLIASPDGGGNRTVSYDSREGTVAPELIIHYSVINSAPTASNGIVVTDEDTTYTFTLSDFNYSDVDGNPLDHIKITALESVGSLELSGVAVTLNQTISAAQIVAGNLKFVPLGDQNGASYDSFQYQVSDGTDYSGPVTITTELSGTFDSNSDGFSYADLVNGGWADGTYDGAGGSSGGGLRIDLAGDVTGGLTSGEWSNTFTLSEATEVTVAVDYRLRMSSEYESNEYGELVLEINGTAYGDDVGSALIQQVGDGNGGSVFDSGWQTYQTTIVLGAGTHTLALIATNNDSTEIAEWVAGYFDNVSVTSGQDAELTIDVTAVNDTPVVSGPGSAYAATEQTSLAIAGTGFSVADVDAAAGTMTATISVGEGTITVAEGDSGISISSGNGTGSVVVTGTLAQIDNLLAATGTGTISYFNNADDPSLSTTITVTVNDGGNTGTDPGLTADGASEEHSAAQTINITAVNDDPTNVGSLPSDITVTEDVSGTVDLSAIDFSDVDAAGGTLTVTLSTSTGGQISGAAGTGITIGGTAAARRFTGTLTDLNNYFDNPSNITYLHGTPHTFGNDADTINVVINDNGNTGSGGGTDQNLGTVNIDITAVNDEQVLSTNTGNTVAEGSSGNTITNVMLETTDVDNTDAQLIYTVDAAPANGTLRLNGTALANGQTFTQADIDAGRVTYDHDGSETSSDSFDFTVDDGAGLTSSGTFNFTISPVNNNNPVITSDGGGATASINVAENTTTVTTVTATDADLPAQTVTYSIVGGADAALFTIDTNSGALAFVSGRDREAHSDANTDGVYEVTVQASDGTLTDTQVIDVTITDVDEFDVGAVIDSDGTANTVDENATVGTTVGIDALASDADATTSTVTYSLQDNDGGRFAIDASTGVVTVAGTIDRETDGASRNITVRATSADGSFTDQAFAIAINDIDEFDVGTVSDNDVTLNAVDENAAIGTTVEITAAASDNDATSNTITYSLQDNDGGRFAIDASTGVVTVAGAIDRETDGASRNITVRATSTDGSFTDQGFAIAINDIDEFDVGAVTDSDGTANTVAENAGIGTAVGVTALASDADATNNVISFTLDDDAGGRFAINGSTGQITVNAALDYESATSHIVTVRATSSDGSSATQGFTINVSDVSESGATPIVDNDAAANTVAENASIGTIVGVTAFSDDADGTDTISYSLDDHDGGRFTIDTSTGIVTVAGAIDREADGASRSITVRATSTDGSFQTQVFAIAIVDVDEFDVGAVTDSDAAAGAVTENAANGTTVGVTALAADADATNNTISYTLDVNAGGRFAIDSSTGVVTVADGTLLDREAAASHDITVRASSSDGSFNTAVMTINLNDIDEFDVGAITDTDGTTNAVDENAVVGTTVGIAASASDADATNNAISYSLADSDGGRFQIDSNTGVVTVAGAIDRETDGAGRNITVRATSADGSFTDQVMAIAINDVDEFDVGAVSDSDATLNAVDENAAIGTTVGITVAASDADATNNAISYSLADSDGGRFTIDTGTGIVTVAGAIDREADGAVRNITVRATSADGSFTDQVMAIAINDVDEFDVGPIGDSDGAANQVAENAAIGTVVGITALATDADATNNTITYSLDDDDSGRFAIDAGTGVVIVAGAIDRETDGAGRNITVRATSSDGSSATQVMGINIIDVNEFDTSPTVDVDAAANGVDENAAIGTTVGITASASDADATTNTITYTLDDNDGGRFQIDSVTGVVTVAGAIDRETDGPTRSITVRATSADSSFTTAAFTINIGEVDEFDVTAPVDNDPSANVVNENSAAGTAVGLTALAGDADASDVVGYSLDDSAGGRFAIDAVTGLVSVAGALDFESVASHSITVRATSSDGSTATAVFTINVVDVNEAPQAVGDVYSTTAGQTFSLADPGVTLNDSDIDGDTLTTVLVSGPTGGTLTLLPGGGIVYTPDAGFFGDDSFFYQVSDGTLTSNIVQVQITVASGGGSNPDSESAETDSEPEPESDLATSEQPIRELSVGNTATGNSNQAANPSTAALLPNQFDEARKGAGTGDFFRLAPADNSLTAASGTIIELAFEYLDPNEDRLDRRLQLDLQQAIVWQLWDRLDEQLEDASIDVMVGTAGTLASIFSVGYLVWAFRGGALLAALSWNAKAWSSIDPAAVLTSHYASTAKQDELDQMLG